MLRGFLIALLFVWGPHRAFGEEYSISDSEDPIVVASIRVTPEKLVLGHELEADIRVTLPESFSGRGECKNLQIRVNAGEIRHVTRVAPGVFDAKFILPEEFHPQFALISASSYCAGRTVVGSTAHALYGTGHVTVMSTPFSKVTLQIAEDSFGPILTDGTGRADIPVVVRPGISSGVAGDKVIDLDLPPLRRIVVFAVPPRISADAPEGAVIWIHAIDKKGLPLMTPSFQLTPTRGLVSRVESVAPGIFRSLYTPPSQVGDGRDRVSVSLAYDDAEPETLDFEIYPGRPAQISSTVTPNRHRAGSAEAVTVIARVFDDKGNPTDAKLTATADLGELDAQPSAVIGEYRWSLRLPSDFQSKTHAKVTVFTKVGHRLESHTVVELVPSAPVALHIEKPPEPVLKDGYSASEFQITATDRYQNLVRGLTVNISSDAGSFSPIVESDGVYVTRFTADPEYSNDKAAVVAQADAIRAETSLALSPRFYRAAVAAEVGFYSNFGNMQGPLFALAMDASLWMLLKRLHAGLDFNYFFSKEDNKGLAAESTVYGFPLTFFVGYHFLLTWRWILDVTGGVGPFPVRHTLKVGGRETKENSLLFGASAAVGLTVRVAVGCVTLRLRCLYGSPPSMETLSGNLSGVGLSLGWSFYL